MTRIALLQKLLQKECCTWMAHTEFTLRPRSARTGVVDHDDSHFCGSSALPLQNANHPVGETQPLGHHFGDIGQQRLA